MMLISGVINAKCKFKGKQILGVNDVGGEEVREDVKSSVIEMLRYLIVYTHLGVVFTIWRYRSKKSKEE